jgi:hypothetical protein
MVPLTGENRVLAYYGLTVLRKSPRPGLAQLMRKIGADQRALTRLLRPYSTARNAMHFPAPPPPDVPASELQDRLRALRRQMDEDCVDFVILTAQNNIEYFTGYRTLTWAYHARPVFGLFEIYVRADARAEIHHQQRGKQDNRKYTQHKFRFHGPLPFRLHPVLFQAGKSFGLHES